MSVLGVHDLPSGWNWFLQPSVFTYQGGAQPPASEFSDQPKHGYVRLIQIRDYYTDNHLTYVRDSSRLKKCTAEDVMIARYGSSDRSSSNSLGRICRGLDGAYNVALAKTAPSPHVLRGYLYYLLQSDYFQHPLKGSSARSVQAGFNKATLSSIMLPLPPLHEQEAIAEVLGALDDKIELNRKMNATLDELARTIFRSWFVDFDPVRAKMEGREPFGMDAATAALFPDRLVDSPLGPIPEGWKVKSLDEIAGFLNGLALQKYPPREDGTDLPVIKIAQLRVNSTVGASAANHDVPSKYVIDDGDFIFSWSGSLLAAIWSGGKGALNQHLFKVTSDCYPQWFIYHWVQEHIDHFRSIAADKATTMGHINRRHLSEAVCAVPADPRILDAGDETIGSLMKLTLANALESTTLAELRDTLLPELISGRIRVPIAEELVGGAV